MIVSMHKNNTYIEKSQCLSYYLLVNITMTCPGPIFRGKEITRSGTVLSGVIEIDYRIRIKNIYYDDNNKKGGCTFVFV
jgi:hypothetical protein